MGLSRRGETVCQRQGGWFEMKADSIAQFGQ